MKCRDEFIDFSIFLDEYIKLLWSKNVKITYRGKIKDKWVLRYTKEEFVPESFMHCLD